MESLKAAATAGSVLTTMAWVRAALLSVNPAQRMAASTRADMAAVAISLSAVTRAERDPEKATTAISITTIANTDNHNLCAIRN